MINRVHQRGFTIIELMVVITILAVVAGAVALRVPSHESKQIALDAQKLAAKLEVARSQSRASGVPITVSIGANGYSIKSTTKHEQLAFGEGIESNPVVVVVGPEPIIEATTIYLRSAKGHTFLVATDGVEAFHAKAATNE